MIRAAALVALLLVVTAPAAAHEPALLEAHMATPGLSLELAAVSPAAHLASDRPQYRLMASGLPRRVEFDVWTKDFGHGFHKVAGGFQVNGRGDVVSSQRDGTGRPRRLDDMTFEPGPYFRGAIWEVAIVSADRVLKAFAKVIPYPLVARDGPCTLSLELVSHRGERFLATGTGFAPGADVVTESRYAGRTIRRTRRVSSNGQLSPMIISHGAVGPDRTARFSVSGRGCDVAIEYEWGDRAFIRH